ncbi:hypothetical protein GWK36_00040 [Caldichromatium japonicum]|uniref:Secreted protein n=1 Tax=Caldichromatium japonicum TaxID=2699430 RepID=A0A6G7V9L9_9GAMM|nr:hypothetical protein [Caldichromatium japonicum]QIK36652.1 hypothetical protein GWK36_00040 [Caldichromatium japonicum]
MKTQLTSLCLLLLAAAPAGGQSPAIPSSEILRPLNLSLPREALSMPSGVSRNEDTGIALPSLGEQDGTSQPFLRYGAGYEARRRNMGRDGINGFGAGSGAAPGKGGGMGRGR